MSLELKLKEAASLLSSERATDRKRNAELLRGFLNGNSTPLLLSQNQKNGKGFTWNDLFDAIHGYALKETEKFETSKIFDNVRIICTELLLCAASTANKYKVYIKCNKIIDACTFILQSPRLTRALGNCYLNLLSKHVFSCDFYLENIKPDEYEEILTAILRIMSKDSNPNVDRITCFKVLRLIFSCSGRNCFVETMFRDHCLEIANLHNGAEGKVLEILLEIDGDMMGYISSEARYTLCEFYNIITPTLLRSYDQKEDHEKKIQLFCCLENSFRIYYPKGKTIDLQNPHLRSIAELVLSELDRIEKIHAEKRIKGYNNVTLDYNFANLAAKALFQFFKVPEHQNRTADSEEGPSAKKVKLTRTEDIRCFDDLITSLKNSCVPWLKVIEAYVRLYTNELSQEACKELLFYLEKVIFDGKSDECQSISDIACSLLDRLKDSDLSFENLVSGCCRNSVNQSQSQLHKIIQKLIKMEAVDKKMTSQLLKLYYDKAMPASTLSVETLNLVLSKPQANIKKMTNKTKLFDWVSTKFEFIDMDVLIQLLVHLSTKETCIFPEKKRLLDDNSILSRLFYCQCEETILSVNFESNIWDLNQFQQKTLDKTNYNLCLQTKTIIEASIHEMIVKILSDDYTDLKLKDVTKVIIALKYLDMLINFDLIKGNELKSEMVATIHDCLKVIFGLLSNYLDDVTTDQEEKTEFLTLIKTFLLEDRSDFVAKVIRDHMGEDVFRVLSEIINNDFEKVKRNPDIWLDLMEECEEQIRKYCIAILFAYTTKEADFRNEILAFVLNPDIYSMACHDDIWIIFNNLDDFLDKAKIDVPLESILQLLQHVCKSLYRSTWVVERILMVLKVLLPLIEKCNDENCNIANVRSNTVIMLKGLLARCKAGFYGPKIFADLLECLAQIEKTSTCEKTARIWNSNFKLSITEAMRHGHNTVRTFSCYCVAEMAAAGCFSGVDALLDSLFDIFDVEISMISEYIIKDEFVNRTSTALQFIYLISVNIPTTLAKTLSTTCQLIKSKSLNIKTVKNMLSYVAKELKFSDSKQLIEMHLLYIVNHWYSKKLKITDFPFVLLGLNSFDEFLDRYLEILIPFDAFWSLGGDLERSELIVFLKNHLNMSDAVIKDRIFCHTMLISLPHIAKDKYNIVEQKWRPKGETMEKSRALFNSLAKYIGDEELGDYFLKHFGDLFLILTRNLKFDDKFDDSNANEFPLTIYKGVLDYFGEMVQSPIIAQLCSDSPLKIHEVLLDLWSDIENDHIADNKMNSIQKYVTFYQLIPDKTTISEYINSFVCTSMLHTLKNNLQNFKVTELICKNFYAILTKILDVDHIANIIPRIIDALNTNIGDRGEERDKLNGYLSIDMGFVCKSETDAVDFLTQGTTRTIDENVLQLDKLVKTINNNSYQNLSDLQAYLRKNKRSIRQCWQVLDESSGFSELCNKSVLHKTIHALTNIVCESKDQKCITLACQCLGEIGPCDLRTIVLMPPKNPQHLLDFKPTLYLTLSATNIGSDNIGDSCPNVVKYSGELLKTLFCFDEGRLLLDSTFITETKKKKLKPFISKHSRPKKLKGSINVDNFNEIVDENPFICTDSMPLAEWVVRVFEKISSIFTADMNYLKQLKDLACMKYQIADELLPPLIGLLIYWSNESQVKVISMKLNQFFQSLFTNESSFNGDEPINADKAVVQCMLRVVDFVRLQCVHYKNRSRDENDMYNYLKLNYTFVSRAASACGAPLYGILYAELARTPEALTLLNQCYKNLDENDAIEDETAQLSAAELLYESLLQKDSNAQDWTTSSARQLCNAGLYSLAVRQPANETSSDIVAHCFARLGDWSQIIDSEEICNKNSHLHYITNFEIQKYEALKEVMTSTKLQPNLWQIKMDQARLNIAHMLQLSNKENSRTIYEIMSKLQLLEEIDNFFEVLYEKNYMDFLNRWDVENLMPVDRIEYREPVLWQRGMILEKFSRVFPELRSDVMDLQLKYAELAVESGIRSWSERAVKWCTNSKQRDSPDIFNHPSNETWSAKGLLLLARERHAAGFNRTALDICRKVSSTSDRLIRAEALRQLGVWITESRSENPTDILDNYLLASEKALPSDTSHVEALKVYLEIAKFADTEYKRVEEYMKSSIFEKKVKCFNSIKVTADSFKKSQQQSTMSRDERSALNVSEKFSKLDEADITNTYEEKDRYLQLASKYYLKYLRGCSRCEPGAVWRAATLWTAGGSGEGVQEVPSFKLLPVLPQLIPRMTTDDDAFSRQLDALVERCCREHPQHAIPLILAQHNSHADLSAGTTSKSSKNDLEPRIKAARSLVERLLRSDAGPIVKQMQALSLALISLANYEKASENKSANQKIPRSESLYSLRDLQHVMVPTITFPVNESGNYDNIVTVESFANEYNLVGGINAPKKLSCLGSDGLRRTILLKGQDDLRQDAVMQQVFTIVNSLFKKDNNSLHLRTYKVVPLSKRSGVLEWCEGSVPIGVYLIEAHKKYRPQDISPEMARSMMTKCRESGKTQKQETFKKVLHSFKPVLHHFFLERFHSPVVWYERKKAYTNSVATNSMVGYILGIGDRHVQNILLDKETAQVIHIDFGIAFELGKALPTPETVPFRLTQDIVDGFGISGTNGLFKKSCEKSLQLLRDNSETLLTILGVLLYDPLYSWSVLPNKKGNDRNSGRGEVVGQAGRALVVLADKLLERMSVSGHVASLVQRATDPANLALLFCGWQPYL